ncbi:hypothetical protein ACU4HD_31020 [Cupriavidus basilensis]
MTMAQFSLNGWKLLLLLLVLGSRYWIPSASMDWIIFVALALSSLIVFGYSFFTKKWKAYYIERERSELIPAKGLMVKEAGYFFLLGLSLTASVNLEQLALNFLGFKKESALLLAHFSIFIPLIVFLNGFIGFYLGPFMRNASKRINFRSFTKSKFPVCDGGIDALFFHTVLVVSRLICSLMGDMRLVMDWLCF